MAKCCYKDPGHKRCHYCPIRQKILADFLTKIVIIERGSYVTVLSPAVSADLFLVCVAWPLMD